MRPILHCLFALCVLFVAGAVHAQATRTWVSGVGDDANPCSRTAPCKTFAGAISKTAAGGVINTLDPGGFGAVTITKSITLEAEGQVAGILSALTNAIIINAAATDRVVLRNLRINGAGTGLDGVRVLQAGEVVIEDTTIENITQNAIDVAPTTGTVQLSLRNCVIRGVASSAAQPDAILLAPTVTGKVITGIVDQETGQVYELLPEGKKAPLPPLIKPGEKVSVFGDQLLKKGHKAIRIEKVN